MNEKRPVNLLPNIFLILSIVALDQVTKLAILGRDVVDIYPEMEITSFLNLVLVQNKGISFGLKMITPELDHCFVGTIRQFCSEICGPLGTFRYSMSIRAPGVDLIFYQHSSGCSNRPG